MMIIFIWKNGKMHLKMCKTSILKYFFLVYTTLHCQSTDRIRIRWKFSGSGSATLLVSVQYIHLRAQRGPGACEVCGLYLSRGGTTDWHKHLATLKCRQAAFNQSQVEGWFFTTIQQFYFPQIILTPAVDIVDPDPGPRSGFTWNKSSVREG